MSITDLLKYFKKQNINIATLTRQQVIDAGCDGSVAISLIISDLKREYHYQQNPPKSRRKRPKRRAKDTGRGGKGRNSAAAAFNSQMTATLELVERVNGGEVETETEADDNPLRLFNTSPGEQFPTFVVIRPETSANVLEDLADALPNSGHRQHSPGDNGLVPGIDY